jgi:hypothetical protein
MTFSLLCKGGFKCAEHSCAAVNGVAIGIVLRAKLVQCAGCKLCGMRAEAKSCLGGQSARQSTLHTKVACKQVTFRLKPSGGSQACLLLASARELSKQGWLQLTESMSAAGTSTIDCPAPECRIRHCRTMTADHQLPRVHVKHQCRIQGCKAAAVSAAALRGLLRWIGSGTLSLDSRVLADPAGRLCR